MDGLKAESVTRSELTKAIEDASKKKDISWAGKVQELEATMKSLPTKPEPNVISTALVGGLESASSVEAAKDWLNAALLRASIKDYQEIYPKGDPDEKFNGLTLSSSHRRRLETKRSNPSMS